MRVVGRWVWCGWRRWVMMHAPLSVPFQALHLHVSDKDLPLAASKLWKTILASRPEGTSLDIKHTRFKVRGDEGEGMLDIMHRRFKGDKACFNTQLRSSASVSLPLLSPPAEAQQVDGASGIRRHPFWQTRQARARVGGDGREPAGRGLHAIPTRAQKAGGRGASF